MSSQPDTIEHMFDTMSKTTAASGPANSAPILLGLAEASPGEELGALLAEVDWDRLAPADLVVVLRAQQRQIAHYQAGLHWTANRIVAAYEDSDQEGPMELREAADGAAAEIGAALRFTRRSAELTTALAVELLRRLPAVWGALLAGQIDLPRARVLVGGTVHLDPAAAQTVVDMVLPDAGLLTTGQLAARLRKLCIQADPEAAKKRYESSIEDRRLVLEANDTGTANLLGMDLTPHIAATIKRRINRQARRLRRNGDDRTMDQLRADIYLDLLRRRETRMGADRADADSVPVDGGVHLTVAPETLAGHNDNPGEIRGFGPVIADIARQVADGQVGCPWTWSLRDPDTGQTMDDGITRRRPTAAQRRTIEALNPTCVHPGCRMPSTDCDIDHTVPYSERPVTCTGDLAPLCRHHHRIRHAFGWSYRRLGGGDYLFRSPLGHLHTTSGLPP